METRRNKRIKLYRIMLTLAVCLAIFMSNFSVKATGGNYVRVNPSMAVNQLEKELNQTAITVYANAEKKEVVTEGNAKTGMYITSNENPEGKEIAVRGDVNADGITNQIDLSYLIRYIIGLKGYTLEGVYYEAGDFKKDGNVNQIDLTNIIRYIVYGTIDKEEGEKPEDKDTTPPQILETKYSEQDWTNQDVKITMTWQDEESGIQAYQIQTKSEPNENGWYIIETTTDPLNLNTTITENGDYYVFVKNVDGKVGMQEIKVNNIDKTAPQVTLEQIPNSGKIKATVIEEQSGILAYKYAKGEHDDSYFETAGIDFTGNQLEVTEDGTYTVYIQDRAGNTAVATITVTVKTLPGAEETQTPLDGTSIQEGETSEIIITPNTDVTIDEDKFIPIDENGNQMDVILEITVDENGKIHIGITAGEDEGQLHIKVLPGALTDGDGKTNEEFIIDTNIVIDNTKPKTQITDKPEDGTSIKEGDSILITIQPEEKVEIDSSKIKLTGEGAETAQVEVIENEDGTVSIKITGGTAEGTIQIEIEEGAFTDNAGNVNDSTTVGPFVIDNTAPTISNFENIQPTTSNLLTVKVTTQDNRGNRGV